MRRQVGRVMAAVVVVGAVISGCGGPGQAGTAVIVGNEPVPLERVQSTLDEALAKPDKMQQITSQGGTAADIARIVVTREVKHQLLERRAAEDGIVVTDAQVDAKIAESGGAQALAENSLFDVQTMRQRVRDQLIALAMAQREVDGLAVTADVVGAANRADAEAAAAALQTGGPEAEARLDPRTFRRGVTFSAATSPGEAGTVLFGVPAGTVVAFQPNPQQSTWVVVKVVDRRTDAPSDPAAVSSISESQLVRIGERMLQPMAERLGVRISPRYGVWDPIQLRVVEEGQQVGMILPPVEA